jgi:UDP-galactopyranose mutase
VYDWLIVGAGFAGSVLAERIANELDESVLLIDKRDHIGGNAYDRLNHEGLLIHQYGPHIFHTNSQQIFDYLSRFTSWRPYEHRVLAHVDGQLVPIPINLDTINKLYGLSLDSEGLARFFAERAEPVDPIRTSEDVVVSQVGRELYEKFFRGYTRKQWGMEPTELPASILKRLPLRFNYDDRYFAHKHQAIPAEGYTKIVAAMLDAPGIELRLKTSHEQLDENFGHVFYSGPIDRYFHFADGRLGYRTLDFEVFRRKGDYQGAAVINYCDEDTPYTRITEHKHFAPWESQEIEGTICYREFSRACGPNDIPYYPIRQAREESMLEKYVQRAGATSGVSFVGRLGSYRYLDMDVTIGEALDAADATLKCVAEGRRIPAFFVEPLQGAHAAKARAA